jgi:hypothetical protein
VWDKYSKDPNYYSAAVEQAQQKASADAGMADQYHPSGMGDLGTIAAIAGLGLGGAGLLGVLGGGAEALGAGAFAGADTAAGMSAANALTAAGGAEAGSAAAGGAAGLGTSAAGAGAGDIASTWGVGNPGTTAEGTIGAGSSSSSPVFSNGSNGMIPGSTVNGSASNAFNNAVSSITGTPGGIPTGELGSGLASVGQTGSSIAGTAGANSLGTGLAGVGGTAGALAGPSMVSGGAGLSNFIKNLISPSGGSSGSGGAGLTAGSPAGSILGALGNYLSGSQTADAYKNLQQSLLQAGDVSQRPGAQWALSQAQNYVGPNGMTNYMNDVGNPIAASYAQHLPSTVAKSGDLTGSINRSMTDMGAAVSGNYNGFIN